MHNKDNTNATNLMYIHLLLMNSEPYRGVICALKLYG